MSAGGSRPGPPTGAAPLASSLGMRPNRYAGVRGPGVAPLPGRSPLAAGQDPSPVASAHPQSWPVGVAPRNSCIWPAAPPRPNAGVGSIGPAWRPGNFETGEDGGMILVTGATGLIGNAIARRLAERGEPIQALVRDPERARAVLPASSALRQARQTKQGVRPQLLGSRRCGGEVKNGAEGRRSPSSAPGWRQGSRRPHGCWLRDCRPGRR
jgi:hypothetical protein